MKENKDYDLEIFYNAINTNKYENEYNANNPTDNDCQQSK